MAVHLILASSSPRRRQLLETIGLKFSIVVSDVDETFAPSLAPAEVVKNLAQRKAQAVAARYTQNGVSDDTLILAADTIVVHEGTILGKPTDKQQAIEMLTRLQGQTHEVFTGVCLVRLPDGEMEAVTERTLVTMGALDQEEIVRYVDSGDPLDKAGSYGIQGPGATLIERIEGDYFTVVGLPVRRVSMMLKKHGFNVIGGQEARPL